MPWIKLDDGFYDHPKFMRVSGLAAWLWMRCLGYAARHLTDGFVPLAVVEQLTVRPAKPDKLAAELDAAGLWHAAEGGYEIHDYAVYNPPATLVRAERERKARNAAEYRSRRGRDPSQPPVTAFVTGTVTGDVTGDEGGDEPGDGDGVTGSVTGTVTGGVTAHVPRPVPVPVSVSDPEREAAAAARLPGLKEIEAEIRRHPLFAGLDAHAIAKAQAERLLTAPQKPEWLVEAIKQCAEKKVGQGLNGEALQAALVGFMRGARRPKEPPNEPPQETREVVEWKEHEQRTDAELEEYRRRESERIAALRAERERREKLESEQPNGRARR